ncbi:MAG TPA: dTDP-4-dehydrorhamnose 3,5-epimerase, partial [Abditibacteriaceae bacterium]
MKRIETEHPDVFLIEPQLWQDERGWLFESFHAEKYAGLGVTGNFMQDNHSFSRRGVLRGLHFQVEHPQAKLCRVVSGELIDVAVDVRRDSPRFGQAVVAHLSAGNRRQIYIPRGFAHGFLALSESVELLYKCDEKYFPGDEQGVAWNDPDIAINWKSYGISPDELILSQKDR